MYFSLSKCFRNWMMLLPLWIKNLEANRDSRRQKHKPEMKLRAKPERQPKANSDSSSIFETKEMSQCIRRSQRFENKLILYR